PGVKPAATFDGYGFTVTMAMTSLAGCSGEEFASILRPLAYRMDKRPKPAQPPPPVAEVASATEITTETSAEPVAAETKVPSSPEQNIAAVGEPTSGATPTIEAALDPMPRIAPAPELASSVEPTPSAAVEIAAVPAPPMAPASGEASVIASAPAEAASAVSDTPVAAAATEEPAQANAPAPAIETATADAAQGTVAEPAPAPNEPQLIQVWRPGRAEGQPRHRRPHQPREEGRRRERSPPRSQAPAVAATSDEGAPAPLDAAVATPEGA